MSTERLITELEFSWRPFTQGGNHLSFDQHVVTRLDRRLCSCWGPAVYKWQGRLKRGPRAGNIGVLVGETGNLRQRIKQYVSGTQERGNKLWREGFLSLGEIRLYTLDLHLFIVSSGGGTVEVSPTEALASDNMRLVLEQLMVRQAVAISDASTWVVNARR